MKMGENGAWIEQKRPEMNSIRSELGSAGSAVFKNNPKNIDQAI
jgi:hypothetical protein